MNLSDEILEELTRAQKNSIMLTYRIKTLPSNIEMWEEEGVTDAMESIFNSIYSLNNAFVSIGSSINFGERFERNRDDFSQKSSQNLRKR